MTFSSKFQIIFFLYLRRIAIVCKSKGRVIIIGF